MAQTPAATLEQLRLLPDDERVEALRDAVESQWLERTSSRTGAVHLADLLIGFANAEGGLIVIGIHGGVIEGTSRAGRLLNEWRQAGLDFTEPPVRHHVEPVACTNSRGDPDELLVIEVEPSEHVHHNRRGEVFLRIGDENRKLAPFEAMELAYDKGESVYDGTAVTGARLADLDDAVVRRYLRKLHVSGQREAVLAARQLIVRAGRAADRPSIAGILLLGSYPQEFLPHATTRLVKYAGSTRETGGRSTVEGETRIEGSLVTQVEGARRRLRRWIPSLTRLGNTGRFEPMIAIPEPAWLEAVVNGLVHRSYSMAGDEIRVELFTDRLEISSPGRLPGLVRIENIRSTRFARNPRVARGFAELGYGRELGEGVNRMFDEMARAGLPDPILEQGSAWVKVTFLIDPVRERILRELPRGSQRFAEFLLSEGRVTTGQAMDLLGVSRPTAISYLRRLERRGFVEWTGMSSNDPRAEWQIRPGSRK